MSQKLPLNSPLLLVLLAGTRDHGSPLSKLRGCESALIRKIHTYSLGEYKNAIDCDKTSFAVVEEAVFPPPQDININMMPFIAEKKESLPEQLHGYWPMIKQCLQQSTFHKR